MRNLPSPTEVTRGRLPVDNMELRWIVGADHVTLGDQEFSKDHVFLLGRIARAANLRLIGREAMAMTEAEVEAASRFSPTYVASDFSPNSVASCSDPTYKVDRTYAAQISPVTWSKPLLVLRTDKGEIALLDGLQRAWRAFSEGRPTVEAYVVTLEEAWTFGLHPLSSELNIIRNAFVNTPRWDQIHTLLLPMADDNVLSPVIDRLVISAKQRQWAAVRESLSAIEGFDKLAETLDLQTCTWDTIRERLACTLDGEETRAMMKRLKASAEESQWPGLLRALARLTDQVDYPIGLGYTVLNSTRRRPVIFEINQENSRPEHRFAVQLSHLEPFKRAALSADGERLSNFFYMFCIELCLTEQFIANDLPCRPRRFEAIRKRFRQRKQRVHFEGAGDKYLAEMWTALGFQSKKIILFSDMLQRASNIFQSLGVKGGLVEFRQSVTNELQKIIVEHSDVSIPNKEGDREKMYDALSEKHGYLVDHVQTFCKAHIRVREWTSAKIAVTHYEARNAARVPAADIHRAACKDLGEGDSLVDINGLVQISATSGIVATEIFPHLCKMNTLCEAWAFLFWYRCNPSIASAHCTPTLVEAYIHRLAIVENNFVDNLSSLWNDVFEQYNAYGLSDDVMLDLHRQLDIGNVIDEPDRGMISYFY